MKSSYQIITFQVVPYNWEVEAHEINEIKESSILPELWDSHQTTVHANFAGNSQSCNYSGGLEVEVESKGWDEVLEDDRETILTIIKHHIEAHPSHQGYHIMTLWEWGLDERYEGIDGDEPYTWWRCLGVVDDKLLPLVLDPSYEINVLPEATHQQPIASGRTSLFTIDDLSTGQKL